MKGQNLEVKRERKMNERRAANKLQVAKKSVFPCGNACEVRRVKRCQNMEMQIET